jgi:hypothetical protein
MNTETKPSNLKLQEFPEQSFIHGVYIPEYVCDNLVDYFIIFNNIYKDTYFNQTKTIIFTNEINDSDIFKNNFMKIIKINLSENYYFWKINKTYIELKYDIFEKKYNKYCLMLSDKQQLNLIEYLNNYNDFIDIYSDDNVSNHLLAINYKYAVIIEEDGDTIKLLHDILNKLLSGCLCFYHSSYDLSEYIDSNVLIKINVHNVNETNSILKKYIDDDIFNKKIDFIKIEKLKVLDYYNICSTIERFIKL